MASDTTGPRPWTPARHAEARARCEAATAGPWTALERMRADHPMRERVIVQHGVHGGTVVVRPEGVERAFAYEDLVFVAAARTDLPDALAEIARLRGERNALLHLVRMVVDGWEGAEGVPTAFAEERIGEWVVRGPRTTGGAPHLSDALAAAGCDEALVQVAREAEGGDDATR